MAGFVGYSRYNYRTIFAPDADLYYIKQVYTNKLGVVFYTELHELHITNSRIDGRYIISRKCYKRYGYNITWGFLLWQKNSLKRRFGFKNPRVSLYVVPKSELTEELFLEGI